MENIPLQKYQDIARERYKRVLSILDRCFGLTMSLFFGFMVYETVRKGNIYDPALLLLIVFVVSNFLITTISKKLTFESSLKLEITRLLSIKY